jgi:hypothetical protein
MKPPGLSRRGTSFRKNAYRGYICARGTKVVPQAERPRSIMMDTITLATADAFSSIGIGDFATAAEDQ